MKKMSMLLFLLAFLGLNVSCTAEQERKMDDIQREEGPIDEAGEETKDAGDDFEDAMD